MPQRLLFVLLLLVTASSATADETMYITDRILAGLYPAPRAAGAPLQQLPTGSTLTVLLRQGDFARVRTAEGREGWIALHHLQEEMPAQILLISLAEQHARTVTEADALRQQLAQTGPAAVEPATSSTPTLGWLLLTAIAALVAGFAGGIAWLDRRNRERHGGFRL